MQNLAGATSFLFALANLWTRLDTSECIIRSLGRPGSREGGISQVFALPIAKGPVDFQSYLDILSDATGEYAWFP